MHHFLEIQHTKILQIIGKGKEQVQRDREVRQEKAGPKRGEGVQKVLGEQNKAILAKNMLEHRHI